MLKVGLNYSQKVEETTKKRVKVIGETEIVEVLQESSEVDVTEEEIHSRHMKIIKEKNMEDKIEIEGEDVVIQAILIDQVIHLGHQNHPGHQDRQNLDQIKTQDILEIQNARTIPNLQKDLRDQEVLIHLVLNNK